MQAPRMQQRGGTPSALLLHSGIAGGTTDEKKPAHGMVGRDWFMCRTLFGTNTFRLFSTLESTSAGDRGTDTTVGGQTLCRPRSGSSSTHRTGGSRARFGTGAKIGRFGSGASGC